MLFSLSCGRNTVCVLFGLYSDRGFLFTCGDGLHGKLALGDENIANHFKPTLVSRFAKFNVESVWLLGAMSAKFQYVSQCFVCFCKVITYILRCVVDTHVQLAQMAFFDFVTVAYD